MQSVRGTTLLEISITLAIAGILTSGAAMAVAKFGSRSAVDREARLLVDLMWELRSKATTGVEHPCLDFPDPGTVRLYRDAGRNPDGFGPGDEVLSVHAFSGGVSAMDIDGGSGPGYFVCFASRGTPGSARRALQVSLGNGTGGTRVVRLLPSTGMARVL